MEVVSILLQELLALRLSTNQEELVRALRAGEKLGRCTVFGER